MSKTNYDEIMKMHTSMRTLNPLTIHNVVITTKSNENILIEILGEDIQGQKCVMGSVHLTKENAIDLMNNLKTLFAVRSDKNDQ